MGEKFIASIYKFIRQLFLLLPINFAAIQPCTDPILYFFRWPVVQQQQAKQNAIQGGTTGATPPVTEVCLGCICEAVSGCDPNLRCEGDVCGLFRITWPYWSDAGKPTLNGEAPTSQTGMNWTFGVKSEFLKREISAYANCANDPYCAAQAVQGYMAKYGQDCNGDGQVNCLDYAHLHRFGGYGCNQALPPDYSNKFNTCLKTVGAI